MLQCGLCVMRAGTLRARTLRALMGGAVLAVVVGGALAVWWSSGRTLRAFLTPVPLASAPGPVSAPSVLPTELALPGGESRELAQLAGADLPPERAPREVLFPVKAPSASPRPSERATRLRRPDIVDRDDARTDAA